MYTSGCAGFSKELEERLAMVIALGPSILLSVFLSVVLTLVLNAILGVMLMPSLVMGALVFLGALVLIRMFTPQ